MVRTIINLFGCKHRLSFPITLRRRTYRTCTECGREFEYDFDAMRIVQEVKKAPMVKKQRAQVVDIGEVRRREA